MPMWPFGRRARRKTKLRGEGPEAISEGKRPAVSVPGQGWTPMPPAAGVQKKSSQRQSRRKRRTSSRDHAPQQFEKEKDMDLSAVHARTSEKRPYPQSSNEDLTALPVTHQLGYSPHLRPATQDQADIPYNFSLQGHSHTSLPPSRDRSKLLKRGSTEPTQLRRKSTKKRKPDHVREEEIRAMSAPIPIPKRPARDSGPLRRESKKMRSGLNRHLERPDSTVSLPLEDSIHSSMSGKSDSLEFTVSPLDVFAPRPKIRYSNSQYVSPIATAGQDISRDISRREKRTYSRETLKASRTIDDLADDLDAGGLRTLMERDQRRRERKRKEAEERVRRKLERRAEKQRAKELQYSASAAAEEQMDIDQQDSAGVGLGIGQSPAEQVTPVPALDSTEERRTNINPDPDHHAQGQIPGIPLAHPESTAQLQARDIPAPMSPPTSPTQHAQGPSSVPHLPDLSSELVRKDTGTASVPSVPATERRSSDTSGRRLGGWISYFRRGGKRGSADRGRAPQSETSFSNTSRESMSRQAIPAHLQEQPPPPPSTRSRSYTPVRRTQSKFREDLPELPLSPPDSRVQSPEAEGSASQPMPARKRFRQSDPLCSAPESSINDTVRTDSPISPGGVASSAEVMSHSLASVDSEGSWLSGKPIKRSSHKTMARTSVGSSLMTKRAQSAQGDFTASYEDLGVPDDEYFKRLASQPDDGRQSGQSSDLNARKASSILMDPTVVESGDEDEPPSSPIQRDHPDPVVHNVPGRQPTVVHRDHRVKSTEGLLNYFQAEDNPRASPLGSEEQEEQDSPVSDAPSAEPARLERARSVDLGKGHARHLSAGSAKLLDIPPRTGSVDRKRMSS